MTSIVGSCEIQARDNSDISKVNSVPHCICCQHLQPKLQTVLLELQTAKKIIELLHEKTNTFTNLVSGNTSYILSAIHGDFKKHLRTSGIQSITLDENTSSKFLIFC
jgi:hypothetical protein